jgi:integrase
LKHPPPVAKKPFADDQLQRLYAACKPNRPHERAAVLLLIDTGLRLSEIAGLRRKNVDEEQGVIRVTGKGSKERLLAPTPRSLAALLATMVDAGPDGALRPRDYPWYSQRLHGPMTKDGFYDMIHRLGRRAGVDVAHIRRFRTTFACNIIEATDGDVGSAQVLMGHSKIETTLQYASWTRVNRALKQQRRVGLADRLVG